VTFQRINRKTAAEVFLLLNRDINWAVCLFSDAPSNSLRASFPHIRITNVPFGIIMEPIKFCGDNVLRQMWGEARSDPRNGDSEISQDSGERTEYTKY
jgi:hypothetical protein